jgi:hypothetical protein
MQQHLLTLCRAETVPASAQSCRKQERIAQNYVCKPGVNSGRAAHSSRQMSSIAVPVKSRQREDFWVEQPKKRGSLRTTEGQKDRQICPAAFDKPCGNAAEYPFR